MGLYLYCVVDADAAPPAGLPGVDAAPVEALDTGGAAAWISRLDRVPAPSLERARAHHAVVAAAAEAAAAVPIRYGQLLPDEKALERLLRARHGFVTERERVRGRVEMGVRIELVPGGGASKATTEEAAGEATEEAAVEGEMRPNRESPDPAATPEAGAGAAYMRSIAAQLHREDAIFADAEEVADAVQAAVAELSEDVVRQREHKPPAIVMAHLVQRRSTTDFAVRARAAADGRSGARLFVTGPWPAYSFVA